MRLTRGVVRVTAVAAVALFVALQLGATASAGREFPTCVQSCNETRKACRNLCGFDCAAIFPNSPVEQEACVSECRDECNVESGDCKNVCQELKNPPSPEEP